MNLKVLKSGTDIRGIGDTAQSDNPLFLSDESIKSLTDSYCRWLSKKVNKNICDLKISVGHDSRLSAERIKNSVLTVLSANSVDALDCGLSSTPAMFMTTVLIGCDGAVQITASHHPSDRNGLKFFTRDGGLESSDISDIIDDAVEFNKTSEIKATKTDFMAQYSEHLRNVIIDGINKGNKPLQGMKIVVDAGNGAGGFYAYDVLEKLGADISGSQFLEPDGSFPNHIPNPENNEAMSSVCKAVIDSKADFGVIFDTDVDRAACVDKFGNPINKDRLIALVSAILLKEKTGTIVTDSVTTMGLTDFIENHLNSKHFRYKRGYKNVIGKQIELCNNGEFCPLAIETSGHAALAENYFLDDGAYLITKIIVEMSKLASEGKTFDDLLKNLKEPEETREIRMKLLTDDFKNYGENFINYLIKNKSDAWTQEQKNFEGMRFYTENGCLTIRLSVHDPVLIINFESDEIGGIDITLADIIVHLKKFDKIDLSEIKK
ncbi:MAG: phosphomannomutase/phosphoglucomutase [Clostridia bacterium]|nr:phosphomannomutase/phosphoglucomutase [Clostridia bacterium]